MEIEEREQREREYRRLYTLAPNAENGKPLRRSPERKRYEHLERR